MGREIAHKDVVIIGGGLAGLTAAVQLSEACPGIEICVLEKNSHPVPEAAFKVGESTIEFGAHYLQRVIGLEPHLREDQLQKMGLRFFLAADDPAEGIAGRIELGIRRMAEAPTWQLDRGRLENALAEDAIRRGVELVGGSRVATVDLDDERHLVHAVRGQEELTVSGSWIVDASGRAAVLRRRLGLTEPSGHVANAAWLRTAKRIKIDEWSESRSWSGRVPGDRRWLSTNHLCGRGYWVWLIPLASGGTSVGVVADPREVPFERIRRLDVLLEWLRANEPQVAEAIERERDAVQDFRIVKGYSHGSTRVFSPQRWCVTGEAGVFLDPLYSPGTDFIGVSNTLITRMISTWRDGESIEQQAEIYDALYRSLFQLGLATYADQYPLLGNSELSAAKITWDILTYFSVVAPLLLSERFADLDFMVSMSNSWQHFFALSENMQRYFQGWHARASEPRGIGLPGIERELFDGLQHRMAEPLTDPERLHDYLAENITRLDAVAEGLIRRSAPRLGEQLPDVIDPSCFQLGVPHTPPSSLAQEERRLAAISWATAERPSAAETGNWSAWMPERNELGAALR